MMKTNVRKHSVDSVEEGLKEQFLHAASSYLRIPDDEEMLVLRKGNSHSFCKIPEPFDEKDVRKRPSLLKKLYHTFF